MTLLKLWRMAPRRGIGRGFTLVELLVVIAIIGILVGILLPVLSTIRRNARESTTRAFIKSIETACSAYEFDFGLYPPDGFDASKKVTVAGVDYKSSECLAYFFTTPFRILPAVARGEAAASKDAGPYLDLPEKHKKNTEYGSPVEMVDLWARALEYDNIRDDLSSATGFNTCGADDPRGPAGPPKNQQGFDLFSLGEPSSNKRPLANFKCSWE